MSSRIIRAAVAAFAIGSTFIGRADSIPNAFDIMPEWHIGMNVHPAWVPGTNEFLKGANQESRKVSSSLAGAIRADMSFNPQTRQGKLYPGLYQGIGIDVRDFFVGRLLGTPISIYVYQGAPIVHIDRRLWIGYEWQFGSRLEAL